MEVSHEYWFEHEKVAKSKLTPEQIRPAKERLQRIVRMLMGLIKGNSTHNYDKGTSAD
jgi:hypothetical protein